MCSILIGRGGAGEEKSSTAFFFFFSAQIDKSEPLGLGRNILIPLECEVHQRSEVEQLNGSVSPWKRAGSSSGRPSGENLYLFLSSKLTSSLRDKNHPNSHHDGSQSHHDRSGRQGPPASIQPDLTFYKSQKGGARSERRVCVFVCVSVGLCLAEFHLPRSHSGGA